MRKIKYLEVLNFSTSAGYPCTSAYDKSQILSELKQAHFRPTRDSAKEITALIDNKVRTFANKSHFKK
jgi:hypothetical protein